MRQPVLLITEAGFPALHNLISLSARYLLIFKAVRFVAKCLLMSPFAKFKFPLAVVAFTTELLLCHS